MRSGRPANSLRSDSAGLMPCAALKVSLRFIADVAHCLPTRLTYPRAKPVRNSYMRSPCENIALPLQLNRWPAAAGNRRIDELLESIKLADLGPAMPQELSGGEMQRVAFARAIAHAPPVVLADEPTANLDTSSGRQLIRLMRRLVDENGCTLVAATHDPDMIESAVEVLFLKDGRKG